MTKAQQALKSDRYNLLAARIEEMDRLFPNADNKWMNGIYEETLAEMKALEKEIHSLKEYVFNFVGGGWNTIHAYNVEDAILGAQELYHKSSFGKQLVVDASSFRLKEKKEYDNLLASFY